MKRKIIFILCAIFAATTIVVAQNNNDDKKAAREAKRAEMVKKATERMKNQLSLTDEQAAKVEELNKEYLPKMRKAEPGMRRQKAACPDSVCPNKKECKKAAKCCKMKEKCDNAPKNNKKREKPSKEQIEKRKKEMSETRKAYTTKLNEILTPQQQEKLKSLHKERKGKRPGNKNHR